MLSSIRVVGCVECQVRRAGCATLRVAQVRWSCVECLRDLVAALSHVESSPVNMPHHTLTRLQNATDITKPGIGRVSWIGRYCSRPGLGISGLGLWEMSPPLINVK